jgi:hypothetical protein
MFYRMLAVGCLGVALATAVPGPLQAQPCDSFDECMTGTMCLEDGTCGGGTPVQDGTSCGTSSTFACMTGRTCMGGLCLGGEPAPAGTSCKLLDSPCVTEGTCEEILPGIPITICQGSALVQCPPDSDPCTIEFCNFNTGQCDSGSGCFATASAPDFACADATCNPANGQCTFTFKNEGGECDDFDQCTASSRCQAGQCVSGEPTEPTPTPTEMLPTPTPTSVEGGCVGDCNMDGEVTIDDIIVMVNIAQGNASVDDCPNGDADGSGDITIEEIIQAVGNAQESC